MSAGGPGGRATHPDPLPLHAGGGQGFDEVPAIVGRLRALTTQMDGALEELRGWGRPSGRGLPTEREAAPTEPGGGLGDTVGGLAHNFNNSLAVIISYTDLLLELNSCAAEQVFAVFHLTLWYRPISIILLSVEGPARLSKQHFQTSVAAAEHHKARARP